MTSGQFLAYFVAALALAVVLDCLWPRPSFVKRWLSSRDQLLVRSASFGLIKHADQLSVILWMLEDIARLGDTGIKKALTAETGKLDKHIWGQLLKRAKKLGILLDKIEDQGFNECRELELTAFVTATGLFWGKLRPGLSYETCHRERMREIGAEQRASWQWGLRDFADAVDHGFESKALALTLCRRGTSALASLQGKANQPVDVNSLIQIEGLLYRVTKVHCLTARGRSNELIFELYCFATGSTNYLITPESSCYQELYLSTHLGCDLAEFDDPPDEVSLGEVRTVISPEGLVVERSYALTSYEQVRLLSSRLGSEGRLARWYSDEFRISALWLHGRRATWHETRLPCNRSAIELVIGN
jgi:hypothetical protein